MRTNQLSGTIPLSLTNLNSLEHFYFDSNAGLCAPDDDAFQSWLQAIPNRDDGPNCEASSPSMVSYAFQSFHAISHNLDEYGDHDTECKSRLGNQYRLADWNDLKSWVDDGGSIPDLITGLRLSWEGVGAGPSVYPHDGNGIDVRPRVSYNGQARWNDGRRHFFISRQDHVRPSYFLAHDHIDNYHITLGSLFGVGGTVLCYDSTSDEILPEDDCTIELTEDGSITGSWTDECASQIREGRRSRYFTFELSDESDVIITLQSQSIRSDDTYLYLRQGENNREGDAYLENDDHGDAANNDLDLPRRASGITATLQAGHYTIEATTYHADQTGQFILTVSGLTAAVSPEPTPTTPAAGRIAFTSTRDIDVDIHLMDLVNGSVTNVTRLTDDAAPDWEPSWSPDGNHIAFTSLSGTGRNANRDIFRMNADGSHITRLTDDAAPDDDPSWSPDGGQIAFTSERDGNEEIYVMSADGTGVTRLTANTSSDWDPSWSPDGRQIAFVSHRDGNDEIYVMNAAGSNVARLTDDAGSDWEPNWSPDGQRIVFSSTREDRNREIYVMNADGSSVTRLTDKREDDHSPSWSPDGGHIAFSSASISGDITHQDIFVMRADGTGLSRLTSHPADDYQPSWSPVAGSSVTPPTVDESFELESDLSSEDVEVGESFTLKVTMSGVQPAGGHGGISVSFPALDADAMGSIAGNIFSSTVADVEKLSYTTSLSQVTFHGPGATIHDSDDEHLTAGYLLVEADDTSWAQGGDRELVLRITPKELPDDGVLELLVRGWVCDDEYTDCDPAAHEQRRT